MKKIIDFIVSNWKIILILLLAVVFLIQCQANRKERNYSNQVSRNYDALMTNYDSVKNSCHQYQMSIADLIYSRDSVQTEMSKLANKNTSQITYLAKKIFIHDTLIFIDTLPCMDFLLDTCLTDGYRASCINLSKDKLNLSTEVYSDGYLTVNKTYIYPEGPRKWYKPWTWNRRKITSNEVTWHEENPYIKVSKVQSVNICN